jgi:hypothetical protein
MAVARKRKSKRASSRKAQSDRNDSARGRKPPPASEGLAGAIREMSALFAHSGKDGVMPQITDGLTQGLVLLLGSAPSVAVIEGLQQAQTASGIMYHNAVANQQRTNLLSMAMTAKCVRYMLENPLEEIIDDEILAEDANG